MRLHLPPRPRASAAGFSLIEVIGVLTIVAIISVAIIESVLSRVKVASQQTEAANLSTIGQAFLTRLTRTKSLPATTNWASWLAPDLGLDVSRVAATERGNARWFLYDPDFSIGNPLPWTQGVGGSVPLTRPRIVFVSSSGNPLPAANGIMFSNLWNALPGQLPVGWPTWDGTADDLHLERVEFNGRWCHVVLNNVDVYNTARYSIDTTNTIGAIAFNNRVDAWFIRGSVLNLHYANSTLQAAEVLDEDVSYVFENGRWGRYVLYGRNNTSGAFGQLVDAFLSAPMPPPNPNQFGSNKQSIVDEFYYYMWGYGNWAFAGFPKGGSSSATQVPTFRFLVENQARLDSYTVNISKN